MRIKEGDMMAAMDVLVKLKEIGAWEEGCHAVCHALDTQVRHLGVCVTGWRKKRGKV
jgi:hypothetical protein